MTRDAIVPLHWKSLWSEEAVKFLDPLIKNIRYSFAEEGYDAYFQLWEPSSTNPKGSFVSLGIAREENSIVYAFGFFYETAYHWPKGYIEAMVAKAITAYEEFMNGDVWPPKPVHTDDETLLRNANVTAPTARRTTAHHNQPKVKSYSPTTAKEPLLSIDKLNEKMLDMWGEEIEVETDMWGEPIAKTEEEEDPLS